MDANNIAQKHWKDMLPEEIEKLSFAIIEQELGENIPPEFAPIIKRVIHTSADFEYAKALYFSPGILKKAYAALRRGAVIVTDTNMARVGINKTAAAKLGCEVMCFVGDEQVAKNAKQQGTTRSVAAVDLAAARYKDAIFVVGNAPTALHRICELSQKGEISPAFVVGVPVGFVNVVESKNAIIESGADCIVARGRKGGSNVAAAICNALMFEALGDHR